MASQHRLVWTSNLTPKEKQIPWELGFNWHKPWWALCLLSSLPLRKRAGQSVIRCSEFLSLTQENQSIKRNTVLSWKELENTGETVKLQRMKSVCLLGNCEKSIHNWNILQIINNSIFLKKLGFYLCFPPKLLYCSAYNFSKTQTFVPQKKAAALFSS